MELNAGTVASLLRVAAHESATLAQFLNDLDGWDGSDCDTGTNAAHTLAFMASAVERLDPVSSFASGLEAGVDAGIVLAQGHIGVIITAVLSAWSKALNGPGQITPIQLRRMLCAPNAVQSDSHVTDVLLRTHLSNAIVTVLDTARTAATDLGDTIESNEYLVSWYSLASQEGLISSTNERTGRIDAGASVLTILFACFDSVVSGQTSVLESLAHMLSELAENNGDIPSQNVPAPNRAFSVDIVWQATATDADHFFTSIELMGARLSCVGMLDPFGVGMWRLHIDTSAPLSVRPKTGRLIRFQVADARPDEILGVDELAEEGITHRGVRLLERRPMRRVERARVLVCTRAPGLIEDVARTGAIVLYNPSAEDGAGIMEIATSSSTGVSLFVPCDDESSTLGTMLASRLNAPQSLFDPEPADAASSTDAIIVVAQSNDELSAFYVAHTCAGYFVPQPGGHAVGPTMERLLTQGASQALENQVTYSLDSDDDLAISQVVADIARRNPTQFRLLLSAHDGPDLVGLVRQLVMHADSLLDDIDVIDGGQAGRSLIAGMLA